jgi:isoquinoline 1-oxidoreductase beta subunit
MSRHGNADPACRDPAFGMHLTVVQIDQKLLHPVLNPARTRAMLVAAAAQQWGASAAGLRTEKGFVKVWRQSFVGFMC